MAAEETDDPLRADRRGFYKVEKWSRDGQADRKSKADEFGQAIMEVS